MCMSSAGAMIIASVVSGLRSPSKYLVVCMTSRRTLEISIIVMQRGT